MGLKSLGALVLGLIFGTGLQLAGMTNPAKVQNFLDLFGAWDPSLAFVMGGAIPVAAVGALFLKRRGAGFFAPNTVPISRLIDSRLIVGSAIFGAGWAIGGFCPGPGIAAITIAPLEAAVFLASMSVGMWLNGRWSSFRSAGQS